MGIINYFKTLLQHMSATDISRHILRRNGDVCLSITGPSDDVREMQDRAPPRIAKRIENGRCPADYTDCRERTFRKTITARRCVREGEDNSEVFEPETLWSGDVANIEPVSHDNGTYCIQIEGAPVTVAANREMFRKRVADPRNWTVRQGTCADAGFTSQTKWTKSGHGLTVTVWAH